MKHKGLWHFGLIMMILYIVVSSFTHNQSSSLARNTAVQPIDFSPAVHYITIAPGSTLHGVASGDFNKDGATDIAVTHHGASRISIQLNDGMGGLQTANHYLIDGNGFWALDVGYLNNDDNLDIVAVGRISNTIRVMLGNGDGTFTIGNSYSVSWDPQYIKLGDLNNDSKLDAVVSSYDSNSLNVFLGNGDGTFAKLTWYAAQMNPSALRLSDFNNDTYLDIAVSNKSGNSVSVFINAQNGTFNTPTNYATSVAPSNLDVGDINSDGFEDIVVVSAYTSDLQVLYGTNVGTFTVSPTLIQAIGVCVVALKDMNNDTYLDMVVNACPSATLPGNVQIFLGHGDGSFETPLTYEVGVNPATGTVADLNNDGLYDVVTGDYFSDGDSVLLSRKIVYSTFLPLVQYDNYQFPFAVNPNQIPTVPVQNIGETYYTTTLTISGSIPASGRFYFSSSPNQLKNVVVDDALVVSINGKLDSTWYLTQPQVKEIPRDVIERWHNQEIQIQFRDVYGAVLGSTPVWIIWTP